MVTVFLNFKGKIVTLKSLTIHLSWSALRIASVKFVFGIIKLFYWFITARLSAFDLEVWEPKTEVISFQLNNAIQMGSPIPMKPRYRILKSFH